MPKMRNVIALSLVMTLALMTGCSKRPARDEKAAPAGPAAPEKDQVKHKVLSFNLEGMTEKGEKKWSVRGQSAEAVSENEVMLDKIVANAYGDEGEATITAEKGVYDKANNSVRLEENVVATIETKKGTGGEVFAIPGAEKKPAPAPAPGEKPKKSTITITCDGDVVFEYDKNVAFFNKNVNVKTEDGIIDSDKITVYLNTETKKLREILAEGNVRISRGESVTYSERATYVEADKKIVLSGRPKLVLVPDGDVQTGFLGDMGGGKR